MSMLVLITLMIIIALLIIPFCQRLAIPSLLGLILTGLLLGANLLPLPISQPELTQLSQLSLAAVLFLLGLELQPRRLWKIRQTLFAHASLQLLLCAVLASVLYYAVLHDSLLMACVIGFSLALAGSALRPRLRQQTLGLHPLASIHVNNVLQLQALLAVAFLALLPVLQRMDTAQLGLSYVMALIACSTGLFLCSHLLLPRVLQFFKQSQPSIHTALGVLLLLGTLLLFEVFGISHSLAALFAGLLLADSVLAQSIQATIKPFKALLWGLFWICIGLNISAVPRFEQLGLIAALAVILLAIKCLSMFGVSKLLGYTWPQSLVMGLLLAQTAELSVLLIFASQQWQLLAAVDANLLYWALCLYILMSPLLRLLLKPILAQAHKLAQPTAQSVTQDATSAALLIIGFGRFGQIVARIAHLQQLDFNLMDNNINAEFVAEYGAKLHYADATDSQALLTAGIAQCKQVVLAIDDVEDAMNIARHIRLHYPDVTILARARDRHHQHLLAELGIQYIWRETYLSALDMAEQLLQLCGVPAQHAAQQIEKFNHYEQQLLAQQQGVFADLHGLESEQARYAELRNLFENDAHAYLQQHDYSVFKRNRGVVKNASDDDPQT